ncbi:dolichyl-phosphate beta-glucosyltransferase-like [Cucumis melo var. makuwa]|uniref:dolichyl-phosphate beta-glucosyltransferase n=1 Tax=Cucumis melo var. makuwa TaxID=1194695 RepID=A0A5A7T2G8_CUCMM|nr:dolichyl-phosphate beta-glucosyltransferase-like [Cucumis melo var. makuwa]TYK22806.1 dolichyl-phosphate beta-glucosyltransferase-like [Cucumis melo var. makuwa]
MKKQADLKRREVESQEGDYVFLKIRPYRQVTLSMKQNEKLSPKYFGPYQILERLGEVAYKLELPSSAAIHPVFQVSQLKKVVGNRESVQQLELYVNENHEWITQPEEVYSYRKNSATKEWEALISWKGLPPHKATWENCSVLKYQFSKFHLEDKVDLEEESDARLPILFTYNRRNKKIHGASEGETHGNGEDNHETNGESTCSSGEESKEIVDQQVGPRVIIIDDGSADGTKGIAFNFVRKYSVEKVRVILLGRNHGKGEAIRKGMLHSRGEILLMLDADGATKITDLEKLENQIHAVAKKETSRDSSIKISDIPITAFGSRAHLEEKALATRKWYRNFLMKGFHLVVLLIAGPGIRDTQCGFKMFTRSAARKLFINIRLKRWCFDVELFYLSKYFGIPMIEVSVNWSEIPGSKLSPRSILNMLWELALMSIGYKIGIWRIFN